MGNKIKLLWIGDSCACTTGFGRVSQAVLENLYSTGKYQISVLGVNHQIGDPHRYEGVFRIYPAKAKGNIYGLNRVEEVVNKEKPDIIIINSDLWVVSEYAKQVPEGNKIITYSPVDALPVEKSWIEVLDKIGANVATYTEFARKGILQAKNLNTIDVIGHGVDTDEFYPIEDARSFVSGIPEDAFVVMNVNRNQPRKRLDLYLKAMKVWLDRKNQSERENICFYYHGAVKDVGWNLVNLAARWGLDDRFLITDQKNFTPSEGAPLSSLCKVYNVADVHVMTSIGEGFGLSPFESAACGVAQIVPEHSACKELWKSKAPLIRIAEWLPQPGLVNTEGGVIDVNHLADILDELYYDRDKLKEYSKLAYDYSQQEQFSWGYVAEKFNTLIERVLNSSKVTKSFKDIEAKEKLDLGGTDNGLPNNETN